MYHAQTLHVQIQNFVYQVQTAIQQTYQSIPLISVNNTPFPYLLPDCAVGCIATITTSHGFTFSQMGVATYTDEKGCDGTFQESSAIAILRTLFYINSQSTIDVYPPVTVQSHNTDKSKFNGGGSKASSSKQLEFVQELARKKGLSFPLLAQERFCKNTEALMGYEVQQLIDELK